MNKRVVALVTGYYPNFDVVNNMKMLSDQVQTLIILDNTPLTDNGHLFAEIDNVQYVRNNRNLGLSSAFNKGLRQNVAKQSDFIIFFDQDSKVSPGLIESLVNDFELINKNNNIGCIGPVYYETHAKKNILNKDRVLICDNIHAVKSIITSSMLSTYKNLEEIGFWNEEIFLDLADWDLCWRFREKGYLVCLSSNSFLRHTLGGSIRKIGIVSLRHSSSIRQYYGIRDSIKLFFKSYTPFKYKIRFIFNWTIMPMIYVVFFPMKKTRLIHVVRGFVDGFMRVNGEFK